MCPYTKSKGVKIMGYKNISYKDGEYVIIDETGFYCNRKLRDLNPKNPHPITKTYRSISLECSYDVVRMYKEIKSRHPNFKELWGITSRTYLAEALSKNSDDVMSVYRRFCLGNPSKVMGQYRWVCACMIDGTLTPWYMACSPSSADNENVYAVKQLVKDCVDTALNDEIFDGMLACLDCVDKSQIRPQMDKFKDIVRENQSNVIQR